MADDDLIAQVGPHTKSSPQRIIAMIGALRHIDREGIVGDVVECGVWRGGNIILARKLSPHRMCWLYDTFAGMTEPGDLDVKKSGAKAMDSYLKKAERGERWAEASVDEVTQILCTSGTMDQSRLRFVVGDVVDTLRDRANLPERIALLRLDTDWHASTKIELEVLYPLLTPGGILIVDDYGHWEGARKAVDEFFAGQSIEMKFQDYTAIEIVKPQALP